MLGVAPALDVGALRLALGLDLRDNLLDHLGLLLRLDLLQNLKIGRADMVRQGLVTPVVCTTRSTVRKRLLNGC